MQFSFVSLVVVLAATASAVMGQVAEPAGGVVAREALEYRETHGYLDINLKL